MQHDSLDFFFDDELGEAGSPLPADASTLPEEEGRALCEVPEEPVAFPAPPEAPAAERIADLLGKMAPFRKTLFGAIAFCAEPRPVEAVSSRIDELQAANRSIYTAAAITNLLERAGALTRVDAEGNPVVGDEQEPVEAVDEDGNAYLEIPEAAPSFWVATPEGLEAAASDAPAERLAAVIEANALYRPIYKTILELCAAPEGATIKALGDAVDGEEVVQSPRRYAPWFVEQLRDGEAIAFTDAWRITELGRDVLATL